MGLQGASLVFHGQPDIAEIKVISKVTKSRTDIFFEVIPSEAELLLMASRGPHGVTDKGHRLVLNSMTRSSVVFVSFLFTLKIPVLQFRALDFVFLRFAKVVFLFICAWLILGPDHLSPEPLKGVSCLFINVGMSVLLIKSPMATQTNHCHSNSRSKRDLKAQALSQRALGVVHILKRISCRSQLLSNTMAHTVDLVVLHESMLKHGFWYEKDKIKIGHLWKAITG